jgi:hypothetical protein
MSDKEVEPTLEQPEVVEETVDVDGLMEQLKAVGVTRPEQLQGKLVASQEAGKLAKMVGDLRQQNEELLRRVTEKPVREPEDLDTYQDGQTINLESAIGKAIQKELVKIQQQQMQAQEMNLQRYQKINGDKDYKLVADIWEAKMADPVFRHQINVGKIDPVEEFHAVKSDFYRKLAAQTYKALDQLKGGKPNVPHTEQGSRTSVELPSDDVDERIEKIKKAKERVNKGENLTEDEQLEQLINVLRGD